MLKTLRIFSAALILASTAPLVHAYDFSATNSDGVLIYYDIKSDNTVYVASGDDKYAGVVNIPSTVTNNGTEYTVAGVGCGFGECKELVELNLPNTAKDISDMCYYGCGFLPKLKKVTLPEEIAPFKPSFWGDSEAIEPCLGSTMFQDCSALEEVNIPTNCEFIGFGCFSGTAIKEIVIPSSVKEMDFSCFELCPYLKKVTFQAGPHNIADCNFGGCKNLKYVIIEGENPDEFTHIGDDHSYTGIKAFVGCGANGNNHNIVLIVPEGTEEAYKKNWFFEEMCIPKITMPTKVFAKVGDPSYMIPFEFERPIAWSSIRDNFSNPDIVHNMTLKTDVPGKGTYGFEIYDPEDNTVLASLYGEAIVIDRVSSEDIGVAVTIPEKLILSKGDSKEIIPKVTPELPEGWHITWNCNYPSIASVDENGKVTGVTSGAVQVYACLYDAEDNLIDFQSTSVSVIDVVMTIPSELTLDIYNPYTIVPEISPELPEGWYITWEGGSHPISVDQNGRVFGEYIDNAIVTAVLRDENGNPIITKDCEVTIIGKELELPNVILKVGDSQEFGFEESPKIPEGWYFTWSSYNSSIAEYEDGKVEAMSSGQTGIEATLCDENGNCMAFTAGTITVLDLTIPSETRVGWGNNYNYIEVSSALPTGWTIECQTDDSSIANVPNVDWHNSSKRYYIYLEGINPGTTTITAVIKDPDGNEFIKKECVTTVVGITHQSEMILAVGDTKTLDYVLAPELPDGWTVEWVSEFPEVAPFEDGKITGLTSGYTYVYSVMYDENSKWMTSSYITPQCCTVTVLDMEVPAEMTMGITQSYTLTAEVGPKVPDGWTIEWRTDDSSVAVVDTDGKVTAMDNAGNVAITAVLKDTEGNEFIAKSCNVTVVGDPNFTPTAIDSVSVDGNDNEQYYTLNGLPVDKNALLPGLYIVRKGNTVNKVIIK